MKSHSQKKRIKIVHIQQRLQLQLALSIIDCRCGNKVSYSSFLLCLASSVLCKMLCCHFSEAATRKLVLDDVDEEVFQELLELRCGRKHESK